MRWLVTNSRSQGGGHAALIGSSIRWRAWQVNWGIAASSDMVCPVHAAIWQTLGIDPSRQLDDAVVCMGATAHGATIQCPENLPRIQQAFQL